MPAPGESACGFYRVPRSYGADTGGLWTPGALELLELHPVTLFEAAEGVAVDPQVVHEDIRAVSTGNKTVALPLSAQLTRAQDDDSSHT